MQDPRVNPARNQEAGRGEQQHTQRSDVPEQPDDRTRESPPPARAADRSVYQHPRQIGAYHILECIGEGGMGIVYKAEQRTPVRRIVALKLIKLGLDTRQVLARFDVERQALALLSHPNVARVLDAGVNDRGRPYFAMEYVPGIPLTSYCRTNNLSVRQRIELFIPVCHAVQHAHQKGIIHRDLKPANILIQILDGQPVPKVIDFGIAKAANAPLIERTLCTRTGAIIGTPEYMSPEQAQTSGMDVDTRTDIYSLGVILYELLTGALPFDPKALREGGVEAMAKMIREMEPPKPSTRVATPDDAAAPQSSGRPSTSPARHRPSHLKTLRRQISGDLDWITLKAMEKDRTRRYETANALAIDLRRHLDLEPVLARPPSRTYRLSKFVRRHRHGVAAAALLFLALLLGIVGTSVGLVKARHSAEQARASEIKATGEAEKATTLSRFLENMLESARPGAAGGRAVTVVDLLDRAAADMQEKLKGQPDVEMIARVALTKTYTGLALYKPAEENSRRALSLARDVFGDESEQALEVAAMRAFILRHTGALDESLALARRTRDTAQRVLGPHNPITREATNHLAVALSIKGDHDQALAIQRELVDDVRQFPQATPRARAGAYANNLGLYVLDQYQASHNPRLLEEAQSLFRQAVADVEADNGPPANVAVLKENLAKTLARQEKFDEALVLTHQALAYARSKLGDTHITTLQILATHADMFEKRAHVHLRLHRFDQAAEGYVARLELDPTDHFKWFQASILLALAQNEPAYRQRTSRMYELFASQAAPEIRERVAKAMLLLPGNSDAQIADCQQLIDDALKNDRRPDFLNWYYATKGFAEYRAGRAASAVQWLQRPAAGQFGIYARCQADLFLAMAHHQLGQHDRAADALRAARATLDPVTTTDGAPTPSAGNVIDWAYAQVVRREAESLLKLP